MGKTKDALFKEKFGPKISAAENLDRHGIPTYCRIQVPMLDRHGWRDMAPHLRHLADMLEANSKNQDLTDLAAAINIQFAINHINRLLKMECLPNKVAKDTNKEFDAPRNIVTISGVSR